MRICWFEQAGRARVGAWHEQGIVDLSDDFPSLSDFLSRGDEAQSIAETRVASGVPPTLAAGQATLLPPVLPHNRIFCVAQNYPGHAQEVGGTPPPSQPVIFLKPFSALIGHQQPIVLPSLSNFVDYEGELAVVIGRRGRNIPATEAMSYVMGFTALNDVSARDLQPVELNARPIIDWFSGKCIDRTTPVGPAITLKEQVSDPQNLRLRLRLNGQVMQDERTSAMVFSIGDLIEYISRRVTVEPGDVISTGTPSGVGRSRGIKLKHGDVVEVDIEEVGTLTNPVVAEVSAA